MKKKNNVIRILLIAITILLISISGFVRANAPETSTNSEYEDNYSPTGDRTFVRLVRTANNKVDVYLELEDTSIIEGTDEVRPGASVASFKIGLDIEIDLEDDEKSAINFAFDSKLKDETYCKLMTTTTTDNIEETTGNRIGEKLHIYYVGTKELNDSNTKEGIKVGTLSFDGIEEEETISIKPSNDCTELASIGHNKTESKILPEDSLLQMVINQKTEQPKDDPVEDPKEDQKDDPKDDPTKEPTDEPDEDIPTVKPEDNTENKGKDEGSDIPDTGDIAIIKFVILMIASFIAIVAIVKSNKKRKKK